MTRKRTQQDILMDTYDGLDCLDLTYYISMDKSLEDVMQEIQMDYQYDHLPSDAMYIFSQPHFHNDVFRGMDEAEFEKYLCKRYEDTDEIDMDLCDLWFDEEEGYYSVCDVMAI